MGNSVNIDKLLISSFDQLECTLPEEAWHNIASQLDKRDRRRGFVWFTSAAALILGISVWWLGTERWHSSVPSAPANEVHSLSSKDNTQTFSEKTASRKTPHDYSAPSNKAGANGNATVGQDQKKNRGGSADNRSADNRSADNGSAENGQTNQTAENNQVNQSAENHAPMSKKGLWPWIFEMTKTTPPTLGMHHGKFEKGKWTVGVWASNGLSMPGWTVNSKYSQFVHKNWKDLINNGEYSISNLNVGLQLGYNINSHWRIVSGINYIQRNSRQQFDFRKNEVQIEDRTTNQTDKFGKYPIIGYATTTNPKGVQYNGYSKLSTLEVPFRLVRDFPLNRKLTFNLGVGTGFGILAERTGNTLDYGNLDIVPTAGAWFRKTVWTGLASAGVQYRVSPRTRLGMELMSNTPFTPVFVSGSSVKGRTGTIGLGTTLTFDID